MPEYLYRRDDGSTFTLRQKFSDNPLTIDPETGQNVVRVVQPAGIIFKGSGFYINDSKSASRSSVNSNGNGKSAESKTETAPATESSAKSEAPAAKTEAKAEKATTSSPVKSDAAD